MRFFKTKLKKYLAGRAVELEPDESKLFDRFKKGQGSALTKESSLLQSKQVKADASNPKLTIMQRLGGVQKIQALLDAERSQRLQLEAKLMELEASAGQTQSALLVAEQEAHAKTRQLLEESQAAGIVNDQKCSLRAVEILAEAGHSADSLPPATIGGSGSSTDGLTGRARLDAALRNDSPELFE